MDQAVIASWIVRGFGGAAKMLEGLAEEGVKPNHTHLRELREHLQRSASAYNRLIDAADLGPGDTPPQLNLGEVTSHERNHPAEQQPTDEPAD